MRSQLTLVPSRCKRQLLWACYGVVMLCLTLWSWQWSELLWQLPVAMVLVYPLVCALTAQATTVQLGWEDGLWVQSQGWQLSAQSRIAARCIYAVWYRQGQWRHEVLFADQCDAAQWRNLCRQLHTSQWQHR